MTGLPVRLSPNHLLGSVASELSTNPEITSPLEFGVPFLDFALSEQAKMAHIVSVDHFTDWGKMLRIVSLDQYTSELSADPEITSPLEFGVPFLDFALSEQAKMAHIVSVDHFSQNVALNLGGPLG